MSTATEEQPDVKAAAAKLLNDPMLAHLETRTYEAESEQYKFPFLVIDSPDKWQDAKDMSMTYEMASRHCSRGFSIKLHGISLTAWQAIDNGNPMPDKPDLTDCDSRKANSLMRDFYAEQEEVVLRRHIGMIEAASQKVVPGKNIADKLVWLKKRDKGEIEALNSYISDIATGFIDGNMLQHFQLVSSVVRPKPPIKPIEDLADWEMATEAKYSYRIHRPFELYLCEFPLKAISHERNQAIDEATQAPIPPRIPGINPTTKRRDARNMIDNTSDPVYMAAVNAAANKKMTLQVEAALAFTMPGNTPEEKLAWLNGKMAGDVIRLLRFINNEIVGHGGRYDFFTRA